MEQSGSGAGAGRRHHLTRRPSEASSRAGRPAGRSACRCWPCSRRSRPCGSAPRSRSTSGAKPRSSREANPNRPITKAGTRIVVAGRDVRIVTDAELAGRPARRHRAAAPPPSRPFAVVGSEVTGYVVLSPFPFRFGGANRASSFPAAFRTPSSASARGAGRPLRPSRSGRGSSSARGRSTSGFAEAAPPSPRSDRPDRIAEAPLERPARRRRVPAHAIRSPTTP